MMYVEPTSQYKFVAKATPNVVPSEATSINIASVPATVSTAENIAPTSVQAPPNNATHFQAPEHAQKQAALLQNAGNAALPGQVAPTAGQPAQVQQGQAAGTAVAGQGLTYDGKRMRKSVQRRTVDYNSSVIRFLEARKWFKSTRNQHALQPQEIYNVDVVPPCGYIKNPMNSVTTKFVRTSTNKLRCPIFCVVWTPEGRRLVTGASSGEFTLWNGLTFNFETILQAHDRAVRSMVWSHNDSWLLTGDHGGFVKYWQSNMNNVRMYEAHKDPVRGLSFSPSDNKYASCSDDGLVKVWDFYRCTEERELKGHGADVKCVDWHPSKGLLVSGSKDSQQPVKLWDPKSGNSITTLHCHKSTVMTAKWNSNGNWLVTGSRDHLLKLFDIRMMKELQTFRGHKKEATVVAWHPVHETLFASGGSDGSLMFWLTGVDEKAGTMEKAHEGIVWSLSWHPLGHILCSGSNDHTSKFWARNRPGDVMTDKYNLDIQGSQEDGEYSEEGPSQTSVPALAAYDASAVIPGVGLPVTAGNVVLPDSKDVDAHLYGEAGRDNHKPAVTQPSTTVASMAYPPPLRQTTRPVFENRPGYFSQSKAMIPGLDIPSPDIQGNQDEIPHLQPPSAPRLRLPLRVPTPNINATNRPPPVNRPPLANHPNAGNRPQFAEFGSRPRHGFDFRELPGQGGPPGNFGHSSPFPPNQFMRFSGPRGVMSEGFRVGFGNQRGRVGMHPGPMMGASRHLGPPDSPRFSESQHRGPRPSNISPGQYGHRDSLHGGSRPHESQTGSNSLHGGPWPRDFPPNQQGPRDVSLGVSHGGSNDQRGLAREGPMDIPPGQHGGRDEPKEGSNGASTGQHGAAHGELRPKDSALTQHGQRDTLQGVPPGGSPSGPTGQHGGPKPMDVLSGHNAPRDVPQGGPRIGPTAQHGAQHGGGRPMDIPSSQHGPRDGQQGGTIVAPSGQHGALHEGPRPNDISARQHAPRESLQGARGVPPGPRNDSSFGPRVMSNNTHAFRPRVPKPTQFQPPRIDQPNPEVKSPEGDKHGPPEAREKFLRRTRDSSPRDSPPVTASNPVKSERRTSESDAPGILGDFVTHMQEMQRGILENIARSAAGLVQQRPDMVRPDRPPHSRADKDRPRGPESGRKPEVGRAGDRAPHAKSESDRRGDRPPSHDRSDTYPGRRTSRDRQDQSRPVDHERDHSDMGRPGDRPRDRPSFEGRPTDRPPKYGHREDRSPQDRPDKGQPVSRSPFDRQDSARQSDRSFADAKDLPVHEKPGLLPIPDVFLARAPRPHDGPPRDPASASHRPPEGWPHDRRRDSDGTTSGGETNIKPLMSLLDAPLGSPPGQGVENRGRKRSMEHEYDRPPKRLSSGDNRERPR